MIVKELIDFLKKYSPNTNIGVLICDFNHVLKILPDATKDEIDRVLKDFSRVSTEDILDMVIEKRLIKERIKNWENKNE